MYYSVFNNTQCIIKFLYIIKMIPAGCVLSILRNNIMINIVTYAIYTSHLFYLCNKRKLKVEFYGDSFQILKLNNFE